MQLSLITEKVEPMQDLPISREAADRILRIKTVLERTGLTRSTLYRKIQAGSFPRQIAISTRCAGWRESAVNEWMRNPIFYSTTNEETDRGLCAASQSSRSRETFPETRICSHAGDVKSGGLRSDRFVAVNRRKRSFVQAQLVVNYAPYDRSIDIGNARS
jgi:prophage regulatory protein